MASSFVIAPLRKSLFLLLFFLGGPWLIHTKWLAINGDWKFTAVDPKYGVLLLRFGMSSFGKSAMLYLEIKVNDCSQVIFLSTGKSNPVCCHCSKVRCPTTTTLPTNMYIHGGMGVQIFCTISQGSA